MPAASPPPHAPGPSGPSVTLSTPDGRRVVLAPGDLVGRSAHAALQLDDPRVSEAHAMVSLRGPQLRLLGLRGRFLVGGDVVGEADLRPGLEVFLTPDLALTVEAVVLPDQVLAVEGDGLPRQVLRGVCGLVLDPEPALVRGHPDGAVARIWRTGERWRLQRVGEPAEDLVAGTSWTCSGRGFRAVTAPLRQAAGRSTLADGSLSAPLRIVSWYDGVQIFRGDAPAVVLGGIGARIVAELVAMDGPVSWPVLAGEIWGTAVDPSRHRAKLDAALVRLRRKLEDARLPRDLVRADGTGQLELVLREGDRVEDRG